MAVNALKTVPELKGRLPNDDDEVTHTPKSGDVEEWNEELGLHVEAARADLWR